MKTHIDQSGFVSLVETLSAEARIFGVQPAAESAGVVEASKSLFAAVATARSKHGLPPIDLSAWGHSVGLNAVALKAFLAELCPAAALNKPSLTETVESRLAASEEVCPFQAGSISAAVWNAQRGEREAAAKLQAKINPILKDVSVSLTERHNRIKALTANAR